MHIRHHSTSRNLMLTLVVAGLLGAGGLAFGVAQLLNTTAPAKVTPASLASQVDARPVYGQRTSANTPRPTDQLVVSFTAKVAVHNVHSAYAVVVHLPASCSYGPGPPQGRMFERDVGAGQRVQLSLGFGAPPFSGFARCPGTYRGTVLYNTLPAATPPAQAIAIDNFLPAAHPLTVGRFTFHIAASSASRTLLPRDDVICGGSGECPKGKLPTSVR